jgi:hypothetical protein
MEPYWGLPFKIGILSFIPLFTTDVLAISQKTALYFLSLGVMREGVVVEEEGVVGTWWMNDWHFHSSIHSFTFSPQPHPICIKVWVKAHSFTLLKLLLHERCKALGIRYQKWDRNYPVPQSAGYGGSHYNPSYSRGRDRRIVVWDQPGKKVSQTLCQIISWV